MPLDGSWSDEYDHVDNKASSKIFTLKRPRLYYMEVLDCPGEVRNAFNLKGVPRLMTEFHIMTDERTNEFTYEDLGSLQLYTILFVLLGGLFVFLVRDFMKYYSREKKLTTPHTMMVVALSFQVTALFF